VSFQVGPLYHLGSIQIDGSVPRPLTESQGMRGSASSILQIGPS
jgi:hypothetical protein